MATTHEADKSESAATDHPVFAFDRKGRAHRYDAVRATVLVTVDGDVVHREQLAKPAVPAWIQFIETEQCGFIDCWWDAETVPFDRHRAAQAGAADIRYEQAAQEAK